MSKVLGGIMARFLLSSVILSVLLGGPSGATQVSGVVDLFNRETSNYIESLLNSRESGASPIIGVSRLLAHEQIFGLYHKRDFSPLWLEGWQLRPGASVLLANLRDAGAHGLCGDDYHSGVDYLPGTPASIYRKYRVDRH